MSFTGAANWRKWDSRTLTRSVNLSGKLSTHQHLYLLKASGPLTYKFMCVCVHSLQQTYEAKRQEFLAELQKREDEMRQIFVQRVKEKEAELKEAEREVCEIYNPRQKCQTFLDEQSSIILFL